MKVGLFPGCSLAGSAPEYNESLQAIAPALGIELQEVPDWNCCGASAAHTLNHKLALALPARILALAERARMTELLVPCSACYSRLMITQDALHKDAALRKEISGIIEMEYSGSVKILNVLELIANHSTNGFAAKVIKPFNRKVACYYGCYLTRPQEIIRCERAEDPQMMDDIIKTAGGEPIDWAFKVECCGAGLSVSRVDTVAKLAGRILEDAAMRGAEAIVVACPMCHTNLDMRRNVIEESLGRQYSMPVLYITQVLGLALGLDERTLGLHRHIVPVEFPPSAAAPSERKAEAEAELQTTGQKDE
jgi:heterodisulfide reductase subunit B2